MQRVHRRHCGKCSVFVEERTGYQCGEASNPPRFERPTRREASSKGSTWTRTWSLQRFGEAYHLAPTSLSGAGGEAAGHLVSGRQFP